MPRLLLPDPRKNIEAAFQDVAGAKAWLSRQALAQPPQALAAICLQVEAIDGSRLPAPLAVELLDLLRAAAVPLQEALESRYTRKPLPLSDEERRLFELAVRVWLRLGIAYLRRIDALPAALHGLAFNRAAGTLRLAVYCHFLAAYECSLALDRLLFGVLAAASEAGLLARPLTDPAFPHLGESTIGGHLAWTLLLRLIDPYRLTAAQLAVTNRAISRWRELVSFRSTPDSDPRAHDIDLMPMSGGHIEAGLPRWLGVRSVARKLDQRIAALKAGESPESLKLGRELSAAACIRLLEELRFSLDAHERESAGENGEITLSFGGEAAYALLHGDYLNRPDRLDSSSASLAHQRMALFGFDRVESLATTVKRIDVPGETWTIIDGMLIRAAGQPGSRHQSPCLVAASLEGKPRLGVLFGLQVTAGDVLTGGLHWYPEAIEAGWLKRADPLESKGPRTPVFVLRDGEDLSLVLPASAGARLGVGVAIEGAAIAHLLPQEVLERGIDFVRYACRSA